MAQAQLATRVDARVKKAVEHVCATRGLKINRFVEDALLDKLEELADVDELKKIRFEATRPLAEVMRDLGLDEKA